MQVIRYNISKYGLGTESSLEDQPLEYSPIVTNRFRNLWGKLEKRQGISQLGSTITGLPTLTGAHEYVPSTGSESLFVSASGTIWKYNSTTDAWDQVLTGKADARLFSVQMGDKLIFFNGVDRNFYTDDAGVTFKELQPIINKGAMASGSSATRVTDSLITNWATQTFVAINDLVFDATLSAYAVITSVGTSALDITTIGSAATGIGLATVNAGPSDKYEIYDLVELNIIPTAIGNDNVATLTSGSNTTVIAVSGVNFSNTEVRIGDIVSNTTRNAVTKITAVSANLNVTSITSQTAGDSVVFLKKAMPIATYGHVHFGHLYMIDARDQRKIRVSGPNDPQDMTTYQKTLSSSTIDYGQKQPVGDVILTLGTFQRYLVAAGKQNVYVDEGTTPIAETSGQSTDLSPAGLFPQGCVSRLGLSSIGNDMMYVGHDGLRSFRSSFDAKNTDTVNISEPIKSELISLIQTRQLEPDEIQVIHYKRRNWVMLKVGDVIYNYNYTPTNENGQLIPIGSWSKFTGQLPAQKAFLIRRNSDLVCAGENGKVFLFDKGNFDESGNTIFTTYRTPWYTLQEGQTTLDITYKDGRYAMPVFESFSEIAYTLQAEAGYQRESSDSVVVTASGAGVVGFSRVGLSPIGGTVISNRKVPLRWHGQQVRFTITTDDTDGPDIISHLNIYGNVIGRK